MLTEARVYLREPTENLQAMEDAGGSGRGTCRSSLVFIF